MSIYFFLFLQVIIVSAEASSYEYGVTLTTTTNVRYTNLEHIKDKHDEEITILTNKFRQRLLDSSRLMKKYIDEKYKQSEKIDNLCEILKNNNLNEEFKLHCG